MTTLTAVARHLNILESAIAQVEEWATVLFVRFVKGSPRFVSKKIQENNVEIIVTQENDLKDHDFEVTLKDGFFRVFQDITGCLEDRVGDRYYLVYSGQFGRKPLKDHALAQEIKEACHQAYQNYVSEKRNEAKQRLEQRGEEGETPQWLEEFLKFKEEEDVLMGW